MRAVVADGSGGLELVERPVPRPGPGEVLIKVAAAGVNQSDVKAVLGAMPQAVWPRTPGRDYSGIVVDGPADLIGKEVWGSGGELGIRRDGTHARHLVIDASRIRAKPSTLSLREAGAVGVPFITAYEGLRDRTRLRSWCWGVPTKSILPPACSVS